jgi:hypothetical protein
VVVQVGKLQQVKRYTVMMHTSETHQQQDSGVAMGMDTSQKLGIKRTIRSYDTVNLKVSENVYSLDGIVEVINA